MRFSQTHIIVGSGVFCLALCLYSYTAYRFDTALSAYVVAANGHDTAAYIPGAPDNATRRVLNRLLAEILTQKLSNEERMLRAQEGLNALELSEQEIDAIGFMGENVTAAMDTLLGRYTLLHRGETQELLRLAQERIDIASDIRGLSYLANHHISEIFNRVMRDGGEMTPEHTVELNRKIPEVEGDFDRRANLYRELASLSFRINQSAERMTW